MPFQPKSHIAFPAPQTQPATPERSLATYGLREWPFREVPEPSRCTFIAGRSELRGRLEQLAAPSLSPVSSIYLFWASLGAGKTHALYFLANTMRANKRFVPIYTEFPEAPTSFLQIYQAFAQRVDWDSIAETSLAVFTSSDRATASGLQELRLTNPDLHRAFFLLAEGEDRAREKLARRWLRGEQLIRSDLREVGFAQTLHSAADCASAVAILARLLALNADESAQRLVWIVDECQRLAGCSPKINHEINAGLQSTFNMTPDNLELVLSFTGKPEKQFPQWLQPELADRIGTRNLIPLLPLSKDEAKTFLAEFLKHHHTGVQPAYFPFASDAVDFMIHRLTTGTSDLPANLVEPHGVRPRALIKFCHASLSEHIERVGRPTIDRKFLEHVLPR